MPYTYICQVFLENLARRAFPGRCSIIFAKMEGYACIPWCRWHWRPTISTSDPGKGPEDQAKLAMIVRYARRHQIAVKRGELRAIAGS